VKKTEIIGIFPEGRWLSNQESGFVISIAIDNAPSLRLFKILPAANQFKNPPSDKPLLPLAKSILPLDILKSLQAPQIVIMFRNSSNINDL
jgi:hypothetical protein